MRTESMNRLGLAAAIVIAVALAFGGCTISKPTQPVLDTGSLDFTSMVMLGNSLTAGYSSGGLGLPSQEKSWPAQLADVLGYADFEQPTVSAPGIPNQKQVVVSGATPTIQNKPGTGVPQNTALARPYNNLGVPGATTVGLYTDDGTTPNTAGQLVLRGQGTQLQQAAALDPTVAFLWVGSVDVLGGAVKGVIIDNVTTVPTAVSTAMVANIFNDLATNTSADLVVMNVPDVTTIPYVTFATKGFNSPLTDATGTQVVFPVITTGAGAIRQATASDYIVVPALTEMGSDPTLGTSPANPLPDTLVVDVDEVNELQTRVSDLNAAIAAQVANFNATQSPRTATLVDMYALLNTLASGAMSYTIGSTTYPLLFEEESGLGFALNGLFVFDTGMAFSLDGVHPSPIGYTLVANYIIAQMNLSRGASIPQISYTSALFHPKAARGAKLGFEDIPDYSGVAAGLKEMFRIGH